MARSTSITSTSTEPSTRCAGAATARSHDSHSTIHLAISLDHLENIYLDDATVSIVHNTFINPGAADRQHLRGTRTTDPTVLARTT